MTFSIEQVTTLIGARRYGTTAAHIGFLLTDSRSLCFPEETLFFALHTSRNDGHHYIPELYSRGVHNFVVMHVPTDYEQTYPDANFLQVPSPLQALQRLAERHRDEADIPIVGITGSNGKTMVKEWLYQLLSPGLNVTRSPRSYNSQIGVPLSVWLIKDETQLGIFEAGISQVGEMAALRNIIQPTIAVLTNIGAAHQENFASMEEKCREKLLLFHDARTAVYNGDDDLVCSLAEERLADTKTYALYWSMKREEAPLYVRSAEQVGQSTRVTYCFEQQMEGVYEIPFIDEASVTNSIVCAAVCLHLGLSAEVLAARMAVLEPIAMRMEVKEGRRGCTLINDSYNSDINSLDIALDFMNRRAEHHERRHTLILSDIVQSGEDLRTLYTTVSHLAEKRGVRKFIGIGADMCACKDCIHVAEKYFFKTVDEFLHSEVFARLHDEVVLVKGARAFGFDQITEQLVEKVHETTLEVNLNSLVDNLNHYRSFLQPDTKLVCMIKADAYGAGAVEIAKTLEEHRVDYLAVAVADEGAALRRHGIKSNVMVMNPEMTSFKTLFDYDLEPEVYSFRLLDALVKAAEKEGITEYPVHIKIDTGMHRLGFDPEQDMDELIDRLKHQSAVIPRSVFSHFVGADSDEFDNYSSQQFERFDRASRTLQAAFCHKILRHIDNSAGIEHFPERQLDMCRLGLGLYGVNPRTNMPLNVVSTLKTTILQKRVVHEGDTVGYSRKGMVQRESVIAAIPIGYADGLNRKLGNGRCYCLVNGKPAPYVGNICMDVAMIDVTDIACKEGDSVEIFGEKLPVTVLSDVLDTIPYEVFTGISNRVKRIYFRD